MYKQWFLVSLKGFHFETLGEWETLCGWDQYRSFKTSVTETIQRTIYSSILLE